VATAVTRKKGDALPFQRTGYDGVGRITERRLYTNLAGVGQALHRVQTAAADDADGRRRLRLARFCFRFRLGRHFFSDENLLRQRCG